ncbi:MAG: radical SAM protein [Candidatus Aminicenantes bacterium]|nr:radical SAM protein [Candidatus Aminicenantes bacterium]
MDEINNKTENKVDPWTLFRMPWSASDNAMTWLEPTRKCNIKCDACFTTNDPKSDKPLSQIEDEVKAMRKLRRSDGMFIAGGEPLSHPKIVEIVRIVKRNGYKPVLVTNGVGLTLDLILELKRAGLHGFTFHVDSHQSRPGWFGKSEEELNVLRQELADMVKDVGGMICGFNITVFPDTLKDMPNFISWALRNIDRVQSYTLTALRLVEEDMSFEYYAGGQKIDLSETVYFSSESYQKLMSKDIQAQVLKAIPKFRLSAYLGGTSLPNSLKLAMGCLIGTKREIFGTLGPKSMELLQFVHHWFRGSYLAFPRPSLNRRAIFLFFFSFFDREIRRAFRAYIRAVIRDPRVIVRRIHTQAINIEQAFDILPNGEQDHCDGCPNKTLWKERLVSACVLDEYLKYGMQAVIVPKAPKNKEK